MRSWLEETLAHHSNRSQEQVNTDIDRDKILSAEEALEYGLIDQVLTSRKSLRRSPGSATARTRRMTGRGAATSAAFGADGAAAVVVTRFAEREPLADPIRARMPLRPISG